MSAPDTCITRSCRANHCLSKNKKPAISNGFCTSLDFVGFCLGGAAGIEPAFHIVTIQFYLVLYSSDTVLIQVI